MRTSVVYILLLLLCFPCAGIAQELVLGTVKSSQAGLRISTRMINDSDIQITLSTQNDLSPAWVPAKEKICSMTFSDGSQLSHCTLTRQVGNTELTYIHKDPNNKSSTSFVYHIDLAKAIGSHEIRINYLVECKKGAREVGQIKIPFSVKKATVVAPVQDPQIAKVDSPKQINNPATSKPDPQEKKKIDDEKPQQAETAQVNSSTKPNTNEEPKDQVPVVRADSPQQVISPPASSPPKKADPPPQSSSSFPWLVIGLLSLGIATIGFFIMKSRNKSQPKPASSFQQRRPQSQHARPAIKAATQASSTKKAAPISLKAVARPHQKGKYTIVNLRQNWDDTAIEQVYLNQQLMLELNQFLTEQNLKPFHEEGADAVPEIGGFILGQYKKTAQGEGWDVFLEKFVAVTPGKSGVYRVSFETMAWAELAEVQDQYPALQTLAWFHTHPGHGLFLSQPDMRIHNGFFKEKYQLAMEIDSLSKGLDTAFFSRKTNGQMNNRRDRIASQWFKWQELMEIQASHG